MAGPATRARREEAQAIGPEIQRPPERPSAFQQQPQAAANPMMQFGIVEGVKDIFRGGMVRMDLSGPITLEKAAQHAERLDDRMREGQSGGWAYEWRVTSGNMHVARDRLERADQARAQGRTEDADRLQREGEKHYRMALNQYVQLGRAQDVSDQNLPQDFRDAQRKVWAQAGRGGEEWSDHLYATTATYVQNRAAFESDDPNMRTARQEFLGYVGEIGDRAARREGYDPEFAARMQQLVQPAAAVMTGIVEGPGLATRLANSEGFKSQELRTSMKKIAEDMEKLAKKVADGSATKDELEKAKEMSDFVKESEQVIITVDEEGRPTVEKILARGALAITSGKSNEAKAQRVLAKEYATGDKEYRKKLDEWSEALAKGKMTPLEVLRNIREYRENIRTSFENKPVTEKSALAFAGRLEAVIKSRGFERMLEGTKKIYEKETQDIRDLAKKGVDLAKKAEAARKAGFEREAKEYEKLSRFYLKVADERLGTLEYIQKLKDGKAPQFVIDAVKSAYWMLGTENDWRGKLILKAAGLFMGNKNFFGSKAGGKMLGALSGFLGWLADPKKKVSKDEADEKYSQLEKNTKRSAYFAKTPDLDVESAVKELEKAGAPAALIKAVKNAKSFIGTAQHWRAEFVLRAARYFLDNKDKFKGKKGEGLLARLTAFAGMVADGEKKMTPDQEKESREYLQNLDRELEAPVKKPAQAPQIVPEKPAEREPQPAPVGAKPRFSQLIRVRRQGIDQKAEEAAAALEKAGAPADVVRAIREADWSDPRARALGLDAARFYADNKKTFDLPQMEQTKKFFEDIITGLATGQVAKKDLDKAETILGQAKEFVGGYEQRFRNYMFEANEKGIDDLELVRSYGKEKIFIDSIALMISDWKAFSKRISDKENITKEEFDLQSQKLQLAEQASAFYNGIEDPDMKKAVEPMLGRAIKAAREGKFEEAQLQLFFAKQYVNADKDYRKALLTQSAGLESGKTDLASARALLAEKLGAELEQDVAKLSADNPAKATFASYAAAVKAKGKDITIEDLQKASDARSVVQDIADSDKLLSQKSYRDARQGAYAIFARTADAFTRGDPIQTVDLQLYLGRRFIINKDERAEIEKTSAGMENVSQKIRIGEIDPASDAGQKAVGGFFAYRTLSEKADILRNERKGLKKGSNQWKLYDRMIQELDTYRMKLANGEEISADDAKRAEGYFMMFFGNRGEMKTSFGIDADGYFNTLAHVPKGDREKAAQLALYAFDAWEKGNAEGWIIYTRLAASMASPDKKIRKSVLAIAGEYHEGTMPQSKADLLSGAYLTKTNIDKRVKDKRQQKKADEYFGQILGAYERGDVNGAQVGFDLLSLFADNTALGKNADKEAYSYIDGFFGSSGVFALAKKDNITFAQAYAQKKGIEYSEDKSASIITGVQYETKGRRMHISEKQFISENDALFLQNAKRNEREYGKERERLLASAARARRKGDETEAARLDEEASYVDYGWVRKNSEDAKLLYRKGVELFDEALDLRRKAAEDPAKAQEHERQADEKERLAQNYINVAGTMQGGLKSFDLSVRNIYTNHRERGREYLRIGINGMDEIAVTSISAGGFKEDQEKRLQQFGSMAAIGNEDVLKQQDIQREKWKFRVWYNKMEYQSLALEWDLDKLGKRYTKASIESGEAAREIQKLANEGKLEGKYKNLRWGMYISEDAKGGYNENVYYSQDEVQEMYRNGTLSYGQSSWGLVKDRYKEVHDHTNALWEINRGRAYAGAENFGQARRIAKKTEARLNWSSVAGSVIKEYERLKPGKRPYGGEDYFDIIGYQRELEVAWNDIERGNYGRANNQIGNVSDKAIIGGGKQELDNLAWELEDRAAYLDSEKNRWKHFNPLFGAKLDSKAEAKYKEYLEFLKTHKATFVITTKDPDTGLETKELKEYVPFDELLNSYDRTKNNLLTIAKGIKEEIPNIKTVEDVNLGRKALGEIQNDRDSYEAFTNPWNTKTSTDNWIKNGTMTAGGQSYLLAFSGHAAARKVLAHAEQGWMITKDSYSMAVENFMPAHYLLRTGKLEKYGGNLQHASNGWLQLADRLAYRPEMADALINKEVIRLPRIEEKTIGDVKIGASEYITDIPGLVGGLAAIPFDTYTRMSGENFLGHSGIGLWDEVTKYSREHGQKAIMGSWGYGFNSNAGRVIVPGDMDTLTFPVYAGKWERMNFSDKEREVIFEARNAFRKINGEFFGDAIKMNDYIISDKSPDYFASKAKAMHNYSRGLDEIVNGYLNKDTLDSKKANDIKEAERKVNFYYKRYQETGDYKYYSLQGEWALKKWELEKSERGVDKARQWIKLGDKRSAETEEMMKDAASMEHWAGPIKVVGYGIVIVTTGGTGAFVIGFKETVGAVKSFKFQAEMAGGYDNLSTKEKVLGFTGIGLAALGAVSPAFSELGLAAHAPRLASGMNWTLVGGGIAMSVYQLPDLYKAWKKGEMSGLALAGNFFANMQPSLQIGIFGLRPKPIANKYARVTAGILFGMPLSEYRPPLLQNESYAVAYSKMPEYNRGRFAELETKVGGLSHDEAIGVLSYFKDTPIPLEWAQKMVIEYRKSHALPENVKPEQKGSLDKFDRVPLDAFARQYENYVPFPEVSGIPKMQGPVKGEIIVKPPGPEPVQEKRTVVAMDEGIKGGEFVIKQVTPKPGVERTTVIVEGGWSLKYLTQDEFSGLHPVETKGLDGFGEVTMPDGSRRKVYHNQQHTENVAQMAYDLAMKRPFTESDAKLFGSKEEKAEYLAQVGVIHDADPTRQPGKPARVSATIEWMDSAAGQKMMKEKFGWDDNKINMAKAIIQRTEFPFDNAVTGQPTALGFPRGKIPTYDADKGIGSTDNIATRYDKKSPQAHYEEYLSNMKPDERAFVLQEAPVLSEYADKSSWYFGKTKDAYNSVVGLGTETGFDMFAGTSGFLNAIGKRNTADATKDSFGRDLEIAKKFAIDVSYPYLEDVVKLLGADAAANWKNSREMFGRISNEGVEAKDQAKGLKLDDDAQKKIATRAVAIAAEAETAAFTKDFPLSWNDNMRKYAAADPAKFAVAEHVFDSALRKAGVDPDKVRMEVAYGDYIMKIMASENVEKAFVAETYAKELPYAIESKYLDAYLTGRGWKGQVAEDSALILKASRGQELNKAETSRMMKIPEDVHLKIRPDMTYAEIVALAKDLNPDAKPAVKPRRMEAVEESAFTDEGVKTRVKNGEGEWMVGGKQTGAVIQALESWLKSQAKAGEETDVIVVTGDKRKLNQINQLFGLETGDHALNAYREIFKTAVTGAVGKEGASWLIRPSESGDEAIGIIVVPKGKGAEVRAKLEKGIDKATDDVYQKTVGNPDHPLYQTGKLLRKPWDAVSALVDVSPPVQVRMVDGKPVARYADGTEINPKGKKGFLSVVVTSTDEQGSASHAPKLRDQLGVGDKAEIDYRTQMMGDKEKASGVAFEVKLAIGDPAVLDVMRGLLPKTGKGLYEVENNGFGIRGLNTFLGHYGANKVIDSVEVAVGDYASSKGLKITRVGTLKYVIEGGTPQAAKELGYFIDGRLQAEGMKLKTNIGTIAEVRNAGKDEVENSIKNGHLDLNWVPQDYTVANAAISAMAIADNKTLTKVFGEGHGLDAIVKMVREHPEIRNVQDIYTAFGDTSIAGKDGPAMKKAFTEYVEKHGGEFFARLGELSKKPEEGGGGTPPAAPPPAFTHNETVAKASELGLDTTEGLATFARKVVQGDKDAVETLGRMPQEIRKEVEVITQDASFASIAKNDALFKSYFEDKHGFGRKILSEYSQNISAFIKPQAQGKRMKVAAGAEGQVEGEIIVKPQPVKTVRKEPSVIVEGQPQQAPAIKFSASEVVQILTIENHPKTKEALEAFAKMPLSDQAAIFRDLHSQAKWNFEGADGLARAGQPDAAAETRRLGEVIQRKAVAAGEVMALSGDVGKKLEKMYGLQEGELAKAYSEAGSIEEGRKEVARKLGITIPNIADDHIFGMLISGDLVSVIKGLHPNAASIEITDIGGGATGAYMVKITDPSGQVHREFVKKVDMTADLAGAHNLRLSGIPAPDVIIANSSGQPLTYMRPDGTVSKYGITRGIGEFSGKLHMAGKDISVTTDKAVSLNDMMNEPWMMDIFIKHPEIFWNELGYMNAAGFAAGAIDGHQGNVFGMILNIKNPTAENIKALRDSGFHVFTDAQGKYKMFRLGRIDTDDSGGTYWAVGEKGKFNFDSHNKWTGERHVFPRLLLHLTKVKNQYAAEQAGPYVLQIPPDKVGYAQSMSWPVKQAADGSFVLETYSPRQVSKFETHGCTVISRPAYEPKFVSVRDVLASGFDGGKGEFYKGMKRWVGDFGKDSIYIKQMENGFRSREGQSVGVSSFHLDQQRKMQLQQEGVTYQHYPNNGEEYMPAFHGDGRTVMMADYERIVVKNTDQELMGQFPHDKPVYLVEVSKKDAKKNGGFKMGKKWFRSYPDFESVPKEMRVDAIGARRHHNVLRAAPGFGKRTGMKTQKVGAVHVFDYIMGMGEKGMAKEFMKIEKIFEKTEIKAEKEFMNATPWGKDIFLNERLPIGFGPDAFPTMKP